MKILYFGNVLSMKGKTATKIVTLGRQLREVGYDVKLASDKSSQGLRLIDMVLVLLKNKISTDKILIDTYSTRSFYYALLISQLSRCFKIPYYCILNGGNLPSRLDNSPQKSKMIFKNAALNISTSMYLNEEFKNRGFHNLKMIPNNIEIKNYQFRFRESVEPKLLWVRSLQKLYNPMLALEVLELLLKDYPEAQLCMVGPDKDGSLQECQKKAEEKELPVKFTGLLKKSEWTKLAADYDIFLNTTNVDNTPISVIEAMALGLPVISTNVGGIPYLLDDGEDAILVPPRKAEAFVTEISSLIEDSQKAMRLAQNARSKVETFDWEVVSEQWKAVLK